MIPYIINVALVLGGCVAFYKILLQKETFYRLNRFLLIACLLISFFLPLLPIPHQWSFQKPEVTVPYNPALLPADRESKSVQGQTTVGPQTTQPAFTSTTFSFDRAMNWLVVLYWFGVIVFAINFLVQVSILLYRSYTRPVIIDGRFRIVEISGDRAPCSFGNSIFINPEKYDWATYNQILEHEKVHIRQRHSIDIVLAELALVFQWFNPFAWLYRKEMENNLEFLTDDQLVQKQSIERSSYQLSLLKVSTPHLPLSLTTNYNQSLLKKRIVMMNAKRSNVHTSWKYFFLLPLLVLFACILNKPTAYSQENNDAVKKNQRLNPAVDRGIETEGSWFATIKNDKLSMQFKRDDDEDNSFNNSTFLLSEFTSLPRGTTGSFKLTREAGTMEFTGKFDGDQGMGHYKFVADKQYGGYMNTEINEKLDDRDLMVFFFINIKKSYVQMLKDNGYAKIEKNELIPLAALNVDNNFIHSLKDNGFKNLTLQNLIPLKSLGIDGAYVKEIRSAGYPNITADQLISFKAQGIDKDYLLKVKSAKKNEKSDGGDTGLDPADVVALKALHVDEDFINSFRAVGYSNIANEQLVGMKALGVTPEFIKSFQAIGYKDISPGNAVPLKAQNITPEFITGFEAVGFKNIPLDDIVAVKALGITPAYITSMKEKGFNYTSLQKYITLKSLGE